MKKWKKLFIENGNMYLFRYRQGLTGIPTCLQTLSYSESMNCKKRFWVLLDIYPFSLISESSLKRHSLNFPPEVNWFSSIILKMCSASSFRIFAKFWYRNFSQISKIGETTFSKYSLHTERLREYLEDRKEIKIPKAAIQVDNKMFFPLKRKSNVRKFLEYSHNSVASFKIITPSII